MTGFLDFDRFFEARGYKDGQEAEAFADWLANRTGRAIVAGPVGEPPALVAAPDGMEDLT